MAPPSLRQLVALRLEGSARAWRSLTRLVVALLVAALLLPAPLVVQAALPPGFDDELVVDVAQPTALAFTPAGDLLVTSKGGVLHFLAGGSPPATEALDLTDVVCANSERGLLGIAVDPEFGTDNRFIYLYYTFDKHNGCPAGGGDGTPVNRVSRFILDEDGTVDEDSEKVLLDDIGAHFGNHNGGDVQFGADGNLYVSVGDDATGKNARRLNTLNGKILRITPKGRIPNGNPFTGGDSRRCAKKGKTKKGRECREIFATGLRNPFRIAHDPNTSGNKVRFFINDVGQSHWEEIDNGKPGKDYGWNLREGPCETGSFKKKDCRRAPAGLTDPIHAYQHRTGCRTITGGAFVPDEAGWPNSFQGSYLFADFICGKIFQLEPKANGRFKSSEFATDLGPNSVTHLNFGPDDALYYATFENGGQVRRIVHTG